MDTFEKEIKKLSGKDEYQEGLKTMIREYLKMKLYYLKAENLRFETKWNMDFYEFEKQSPQFPHGMSYEVEQEYYDWEGIITDIQYYKKELEAWK